MIEVTTEPYSNRNRPQWKDREDITPKVRVYDNALHLSFDTAPTNHRSRWARVTIDRDEMLKHTIEAHGGVAPTLSAIAVYLVDREAKKNADSE